MKPNLVSMHSSERRLPLSGVALAAVGALAVACGSGQTVGAAPAGTSSSQSSSGGQESKGAPVPPSDPEIFGYDVSFPQCDTQLPEPGAFAIVGANENLPTIPNPCFDELAAWAEQSTGATSQPKLSVYVTAANPGQENVPTWPQAGENKYGACAGEDSSACAYEYGQDRIAADIATVAPRPAGELQWWIDVEPEYSWEAGADGQTRNGAVLEGMADVLKEQGARVGFYSSPAIWQQIVGQTPDSLVGSDNWVLGAHSHAEAQANCGTPSFTDGGVVLAQYVTGSLDRNVAC